jgi:hypothetical protein
LLVEAVRHEQRRVIVIKLTRLLCIPNFAS